MRDRINAKRNVKSGGNDYTITRLKESFIFSRLVYTPYLLWWVRRPLTKRA
jgi:hypothetical protein